MKVLNAQLQSFYVGLCSLTVFLLPIITHAQGGLVPCSGAVPEEGQPRCDYGQFITLINNAIEWLIVVAIAVSSLLFMYAGFLYLTAGGDKSQADRAKSIFGNVAIGFAIILIAWLAVSAIVRLLTTEEWRNENSDVIPINVSLKETHELNQLL